MRKLISVGLAAAALATSATGLSSVASAQTVVVERYGHWDPTWGREPPPPMARWHNWRGEHRGEWYAHVHGCMTRYHGYDARRDMYYQGHRWRPCRD
jgi:hypothetical protein